MSNATAEVIIVGGGIAGLTTALALNQVGISSLVLERTNFEDESGVGIQLTPNATRILFQLGLKSSLIATSHEPTILDTRHWKTGAVLSTVPLQEIVAQYCEFPYLQILRSHLIEILRASCVDRSNIELEPSVEVIGLEQSKDKVTLSSNKGKFSSPMVIGADGIHSTVSGLIGNTEQPQFSGWQAWRALLHDPSLNVPGLENTNLWCGTIGHIVHYPVYPQECYNFVFITKSKKTLPSVWKQNGKVSELSEYFRHWHQEVNTVIRLLDDCHLFRWGLFHFARTKRLWNKNRVLLLGDSIHSTMPFLAQGAALAIEDASTFATRMIACSKDVPKAIESFVALRKKRVQKIQAQSERMGDVYRLRFPWSKFRDWGTKWAVAKLARDIYSFETL